MLVRQGSWRPPYLECIGVDTSQASGGLQRVVGALGRLPLFALERLPRARMNFLFALHPLEI